MSSQQKRITLFLFLTVALLVAITQDFRITSKYRNDSRSNGAEFASPFSTSVRDSSHLSKSLVTSGLDTILTSQPTTDHTVTVANNGEAEKAKEGRDAISSRPRRQHAHHKLASLARGAFHFSEERRKSYEHEARPSHWKMRGTGHLFARRGILLAATLPEETKKVGKTIVRIDDVVPIMANIVENNNNGTFDMDMARKIRNGYEPDYCSRLTIWVRVNGPEIFAGSAISVVDTNHANANNEQLTSSCHWEFPFDLRVPGKYEVDVKVLTWNGNAALDIDPSGERSRCNLSLRGGPEAVTADLEALSSNQTSNIVSGGFIGFKFYYPTRSCCEVCSRTRHCVYWATPPKGLSKPSRVRNGCELYFDNGTGADPEHDYMPSNGQMGLLLPEANFSSNMESDVERSHGRPADVSIDDIAYFVGCGWSFWFTLDFPCVSGDLDDRVFSQNTSFYLSPEHGDSWVEGMTTQNNTTLPLCVAENEDFLNHTGRWVRLPFPSEDICPNLVFDKGNRGWDITKFDPEQPYCWYWDDLSRMGTACVEMNCQLLRKRPQATWMSSLHKEKKWFGYWQNYHCDYLEFTNSQLQRCISDQKVSSILHVGKSISENIEKYVNHRTEDVVFYDSSQPDHRTVTISTLGLLHISYNNREKLREKFRNLPNATESNDYYWVSTLFQSSERDAMLFSDYQYNVSVLAEGILREKGWKMLNAFDTSAAFTYDTAGQNDGMHIVGPPMKSLVTKLFHYMCADSTAESSRVGIVPTTRVVTANISATMKKGEASIMKTTKRKNMKRRGKRKENVNQ